jgi:putative addiction module killer protein
MRVAKTAEYAAWLDRLNDRAGRARILVRVERLIHGNPGDHRNLPGGISELRIDVGPGYRVYYSLRGNRLLLLLIGGDKSTQARDIVAATQLARAFEEDES